MASDVIYYPIVSDALAAYPGEGSDPRFLWRVGFDQDDRCWVWPIAFARRADAEIACKTLTLSSLKVEELELLSDEEMCAIACEFLQW